MAADYLWSGLYSRIQRKGKHVPVHLILRRIRRRTVQPLKAAQEARDYSRERFTIYKGSYYCDMPQCKAQGGNTYAKDKKMVGNISDWYVGDSAGGSLC